MLKKIVCIIGAVAIFILAVGCSSEPQKPKLGVSFGVGGATRWVKEKQFMEDRAKELGADIFVLILLIHLRHGVKTVLNLLTAASMY